MLLRLAAFTICLLLASSAQALVLRVSAEAPLSVERLADALRSYVDGAEVEVAAVGRPDARDGAPTVPGVVEVALRRQGVSDEDVELVLLDGETTILNRLPGAMRIEDLYRTVALKVHALLQRRVTASTAPTEVVGDRRATSRDKLDRLMLDAGLAFLVPSAGPVREGLRLGAGLRLSTRWHLLVGAYLEAEQSTRANDIAVSTWELPIFLNAGFDWHQGTWAGWLDLVGHAAVRRISAQAPEAISNSDVTLSPRVGGAAGLGIPVGRGLHLQLRLALLAVLSDSRYRVDTQEIWPSARTLGMVELGLGYRGW
jgi:hypothetical protein